MIYWAPFLHFYQPPTQFHAIFKKICRECYRPLVKMFLEHPSAKATVNICGVLTEMFNDHGAEDVLRDVKKLAQAGQFEFVDSAKYHAILPLISPKESKRQIEHNRQTNQYFFKETYKVRGLFPPEMCYSSGTAKVISDMGYDWILIGGIACRDKWPVDFISSIPGSHSPLHIFYRDDILSNKISFNRLESKAFLRELMWLTKGKKDAYVITAMDAETFGHHIPQWEKLFLAKVYETIDTIELKDVPRIEAVTISELLKKFPSVITKAPRASSWSTLKDDVSRKNYYPLWKDIDNPIHTLQWEHLDICSDLVNGALSLKGNGKESIYFADIARVILDKALHSCQFWWANKKRGMWSINMINKGLVLQEETVFNAYKAIALSSLGEKRKRHFHQRVKTARDIANKIRDILFIEP